MIAEPTGLQEAVTTTAVPDLDDLGIGREGQTQGLEPQPPKLTTTPACSLPAVTA